MHEGVNITAAGAVYREFFLYILDFFWFDTGLKLLIRGRASFSQSMSPQSPIWTHFRQFPTTVYRELLYIPVEPGEPGNLWELFLHLGGVCLRGAASRAPALADTKKSLLSLCKIFGPFFLQIMVVFSRFETLFSFHGRVFAF